ncbi:uncharacterized protein LOC135218332 isoform X2 [Macrobrachium nipponense]|uniref:uncharacterized protein LOC135218332 isoform X2 n=1 Tax=Macrobrachium nipponense TaxID=159736 RepID=UPI0030C8A4FA
MRGAEQYGTIRLPPSHSTSPFYCEPVIITCEKEDKECGESTKNDKIPVENCSPSDTITTEAHNNSSDILADVIHKEGISELNTITFAETDGLSKYDGDLSEESEVGTKRKNRKRMKSKQSEAEKKKKLAEKSKQNRIRKNEEFASLRQSNKTLKNEIQTLQNQNQTLKNQNHEKDRIIASLTPNQGMSENVPNNPQSASAENKLDEEEFTEMMYQAGVEAFDHEKFLKLMNNWFRSKGRSEIRVNDRESTAGVVRVERGEQKMKIRVLKYYRKMESYKERYKKCKEDHEHNGLE